MTMPTGFTADFLGCMKSCLLSVLWPKKDIVQFFLKHGCDRKDLDTITLEPNRSAMIDKMFSLLEEKPDGGLGPLRAMLQSLLNWSYFDPYWFDNQKKLDRGKARLSLDHLKQLQEIRDAKIREARKTRESGEAAAQEAKKTLAEVRKHHLDLQAGLLTAQARGYALEGVLRDLARLSKLEVTDPFVVTGEQVDGALKYEGEHYIVEAKWQEAAAGNEGVYQFSMKVEGRMYGRGLFISIRGFSAHVVSSITSGKALRTIFIDGEDLMLVIDEHLTFDRMIDRKVKAAQTKGLVYVHPISGQPKLGI